MRDSLKQLVDTGFLRDKNFPEFISILNSWLENNYSYDGFKIYDSVFNRALTDALFHISGFPGTKYRRVTPKNFLAILNECAKAKKQDAWSAMLFYLDIHEILTTERLGKLLELTNSYYDHPYWASPVKEILELSGHFDAAPKSSKIALMDALIDWHLDFASENTAEDRIAVKGITSKLLKDLKSLELDTLYYADPYLVAAAFLNQGLWPYLSNNNHITHWPFARITSLGNRKIQDLSLKELEKLIITIRLSHQESSDSETTW